MTIVTLSMKTFAAEFFSLSHKEQTQMKADLASDLPLALNIPQAHLSWLMTNSVYI